MAFLHGDELLNAVRNSYPVPIPQYSPYFQTELYAWRFVVAGIRAHYFADARHFKKVAIIGTGNTGNDIAEYIKQKIAERIRQCSQTVVYITDNTHSSDWVKWEVEKSLQLGKGVIAVHKGDTPPSSIPSCITDNGIKVVTWSNLSEYL